MTLHSLSSARHPTRQAPVRHRRVKALLLLALVLAPASVLAQGIVRWVDDKGQVHYSDHAPPGHTAVSAVSHAPPPSEPAATADPASSTNSGNTTGGSSSSSDDGSAAADAERKRQAEQQRAAAAARKKEDQDVIARCKADHETYCNEGADSIRQHEKIRAMMQCADNVNQYGAMSPACRNGNF